MTKPTTVVVHNQQELDKALADKASTIHIESAAGVWLNLTDTGSSRVVARGSSSVVAWDSSSVDAWDSSRVVAWGSSSVDAWGSSSVDARGSSSVVAWGSSSVVAWGSSSVVARGSSSVVAWDSSRVDAWGSSSVVARGSSSVVAWDSSRVDARGSSSVDAWGSSSVVARDSSRVDAGKYVAVHLHSQRVTLGGDGHVIDLTKVDLTDPATWCDYHGVKVVDGVAFVFKAVWPNWHSCYKTSYEPGSLPEAPDWKPTRECGNGLHFGASPTHALETAANIIREPRFLICGVQLDELVCLDGKVKAPRVVVACVEVDRFGDLVEAEAVAAK